MQLSPIKDCSTSDRQSRNAAFASAALPEHPQVSCASKVPLTKTPNLTNDLLLGLRAFSDYGFSGGLMVEEKARGS